MDMYGLHSGDWAFYMRLVGAMEPGYDEVQQVHLHTLVWIRHGEK